MGCSTPGRSSNTCQETSGEHSDYTVTLEFAEFTADMFLSNRLAKRIRKLNKEVVHCIQQKLCVSDHFRKTVEKYPNKVAIVFEEHQLTFRELDILSNQIANVLRASRLHQHGDIAAIFMTNCMEYIAVYLAMCKLGITGVCPMQVIHSRHVTLRYSPYSCHEQHDITG